VGAAQAQLETAAARVRQAEAQLQALRLQLGYTHVVAPHEGVVSQKNVSAGQTVAIGQPLLAIADVSAPDVVANFKETQLAGMRVGSRAEVEVDAYPGRSFRGHVASLSAGTGAVFSLLPPENASGNFTKVVQRVPVKIAIDEGLDDRHPLRIGMSCTVTVSLQG
jgi:membrane fusion protein (multidrug efflux system)